VDRCDECGFEYDLDEAPGAGAAIVRDADEIAAILTNGSADLGRRRRLNEWSPLEYGCHVREVLLVQRERVLAARRMERPSFDPMGRDERVLHDGYADQAPPDVARQLADAARLFANDLARLEPADWERTLMYTYPASFERSLRWVAVHTVHELRHHLLDVRHLT
jgi:hypothetical protein